MTQEEIEALLQDLEERVAALESTVEGLNMSVERHNRTGNYKYYDNEKDI